LQQFFDRFGFEIGQIHKQGYRGVSEGMGCSVELKLSGLAYIGVIQGFAKLATGF
jgi:hypothetical protein